jgi:hypothetical protein
MQTRLPNPALTAFMDRGAREDAEGAMCLAACLFKRTPYQEFERRWRTLHRPLGVDVFHACDFYPGGGAYRKVDRARKEQIARQIPDLLNATLHQVVAVTFRKDEFWRVAGDRWRARYGPSLYSAAVQLCLGCISRWADERRYTGTIAYKIEAGEEDQAYAEAALVQMRASDGLRAGARYHSHEFLKKTEAVGLQAADCFAWHWNKYYAETLFVAKRPPRGDFAALVLADTKRYRVHKFTDDMVPRLVEEFLAKPVILPVRATGGR